MAADKVFVGLKLQTVASLDTAGRKGKLVRLESDGHVYHDNGKDWDDLTEATDETLDLRIAALERVRGPKTILAPRRSAFRAMIGKKHFLNKGGHKWA